MNIKRITRLLKLLQLLQSGSGQNADGLAKSCGVIRRTTFRDIKALRAVAVSVSFDEQRDRYSIPATYFLPPINFTPAEAMSLVARANEMGRGDRMPFYEPAQRAAHKLEDCLPVSLRQQLKELTQGIRIQPMPVSPLAVKKEFCQQLVDARARRRVVRIEYDSLTEWERIETKLRPYHRLFSRHSWYVIGRSSLHREVLEPHRVAGDAPGEICAPARVQLRTTLGQRLAADPRRWHGRPCRDSFQAAGRPKRGRSDLAQEAKAGVPIGWFAHLPSASFRTAGDHVVDLGYGNQAEVLEPPELSEMVAKRAKALAAVYNGANV